MTASSGTITFNAPRPRTEGTAASGSWLILRQADIPADQKQATPRDVSAMLSQLRSGRSAYTAIRSCSVQRLGGGMARATVEVEVHRAEDVEYELEITKDGVLLDAVGPMLATCNADASYDINYNQTQQLGFLLIGSGLATWEGLVYDTNGQLTHPPPITVEDGYLYIPTVVFGTVRVRGLKVYDRWTVRIDHQTGTRWNASLWAAAWWPAGRERDLQQSTSVELKLSQCVLDAFDDCTVDTSGGEDVYSGGGGVYSGGTNEEEQVVEVIVNPPRKFAVNRCTAEVVGELHT